MNEMDKLERVARKQLLFTKIICGISVVIAVAMLIFLAMTVPRLTSVLEKTNAVLEKTDAILEEVDLDAIDDLNETVQTLNQAVGLLKKVGE